MENINVDIGVQVVFFIEVHVVKGEWHTGSQIKLKENSRGQKRSNDKFVHVG